MRCFWLLVRDARILEKREKQERAMPPPPMDMYSLTRKVVSQVTGHGSRVMLEKEASRNFPMIIASCRT